jgi:hypothetical protein
MLAGSECLKALGNTITFFWDVTSCRVAVKIQVADSIQNINEHLPQLQHITSETTIIKYLLTFLKMYKLAGWAIT